MARSGVAVVAVVLTLVLVGCGADSAVGPEDGARDGAQAPDTSESSSPATSQSPTPAETESSPGVAPATGPVLKVAGLRVNAPRGWDTTIRVNAGHGAFPRGILATMMTLNLFPNSSIFTIEELAEADLGYMGARKKRLDDLTIDDHQFFHLRGSTEPGVETDRFGSIVNDKRVSIVFRFLSRKSRDERDALIQSVLATARVG